VAGAALLAGLAFLASVVVRTERQVQADLHPDRRLPGPPPAGPGLDGLRPVRLETADGVALAAWWVPPRNGAAVVVAHGWAGNREQLLPQAGPLAARGFGLLLLDLRAHGESGGARCLLGDGERLDVAAATDFVAAQPGVRAVGAVGFSIGAIAAAEAALGDPRLRALVLEAPHLGAGRLVHHDYGRWGALSRWWAARRFREEGVRLDREPVLAACGRAEPPLVVAGEHDEEVTAAELAALRSACGAGNVYTVAGGGHGGWEGDRLADLVERVAGHLERGLGVRGEGGP
jgi:pimeloyl-ACP methyl ester carboxylesterase